MHVVEAVLGLVVASMAIASLAERLRTPAPSLLVVVGLGVGLVPGVPVVHVDPLLITIGVLPPLLFAAAEQLSLPDLLTVWRTVAVLALGLVAVTGVAVALVTRAVYGSIGLAAAFVLGAILASTDPVAVTALSRTLRLPQRIATLVQAESLFNDATSLVMFQLAVAAVTTVGMTGGDTLVKFLRLAAGGVALGLAVGLVAATLLRRAHDPTVQTAVAVVTPYAAAVAAEALGVSVVTAVIVTGLALARRRSRRIQPRGRLMAAGVYDTLVFLLESVVFAVIGLQLAAFAKHLPADDRGHAIALIAAVTGTLLAVRGASLLAGLLRRRSRETRSWRSAAVVTWAGARGVVPLAAALSVPLTAHGAPFPHRSLLLVVATGTVVITLVVQGSTLSPLVRRLGVVGDAGAAAEQEARARYALAVRALDALEEAVDAEDAPPSALEVLRVELQTRVDVTRAGTEPEASAPAPATAVAAVRRRLLDVQGEELARLRSAGEIDTDVYRALQRELDLEHSRLDR